MEVINEYQAQGAFIRAKSRYKVEGERPTKLFCSLERHNSVQKYIPKLRVVKDNNEMVLTEQKLVENEIFEYYGDLFSPKNTELNEINEFLSEEIMQSCPKLSENQ